MMKNCGHQRAWYPVILLDEESSDSSPSVPEMSNDSNNNSCNDNLPACPSTSRGPRERRASRSRSRGRSRSKSRSHHMTKNKRDCGDKCCRRRSRSRSRSRSPSKSRGRRMEREHQHGHSGGERRCDLFPLGHHHKMKEGHHSHHGHHGRHIYHFMKKSKGHHHRHHGSRPMSYFLRHELKHTDHCRAFRGPINHGGLAREVLIRTLAEVLERVNAH